MKMKYTFSELYNYFLAKYRYVIFYSFLSKLLIRKHIFEQISYRILVMDEKCFNDGECKLCGCETIALQMTNTACKKPCYPDMMSKGKWLTSPQKKYYELH